MKSLDGSMEILVVLLGYATVYSDYATVEIEEWASRVSSKKATVRLNGFVFFGDNSAETNYDAAFLVESAWMPQSETPITDFRGTSCCHGSNWPTSFIRDFSHTRIRNF